ncbi:MAG: hypothetical protein R2792_14805 [Saprospiraceae bacterium]
MASSIVYGNKPDTGPGRLSAQAALDDANQDHADWNVQMEWTADRTTYTSANANVTDINMVDYFTPKFPGYHVS